MTSTVIGERKIMCQTENKWFYSKLNEVDSEQFILQAPLIDGSDQ